MKKAQVSVGVVVVVAVILIIILMQNVDVQYLTFTVGDYSVTVPEVTTIQKPRITSFLEQQQALVYSQDRAEVVLYNAQTPNCYNRYTNELDYSVCGIYNQTYYGITKGANVKRFDYALNRYTSYVLKIRIYSGNNLIAKNEAQIIR